MDNLLPAAIREEIAGSLPALHSFVLKGAQRRQRFYLSTDCTATTSFPLSSPKPTTIQDSNWREDHFLSLSFTNINGLHFPSSYWAQKTLMCFNESTCTAILGRLNLAVLTLQSTQITVILVLDKFTLGITEGAQWNRSSCTQGIFMVAQIYSQPPNVWRLHFAQWFYSLEKVCVINHELTWNSNLLSVFS